MTKIFDIGLANSDINSLIGYFAVSWLSLIWFFQIGVIVGSFNNRNYSAYILIGLWLFLVFIIPGGLNTYASKKAERLKSSYKTEYEQWVIVDEFENLVVEKLGKFAEDKRSEYAKMAEYYYEDVYPKIEEIENNFRCELAKHIDNKRDISILFPTTFCQLTGNYVSGFGNDNFLRYYSFLQVEKKGFLRFFIDRVYYNDPKVMVSYIDENHTNLFYASATLPENFLKGVVINLGYCFILFFAAFFRFKRVLFPILKTGISTEKLTVNLKTGERTNLHSYVPEILPQFVNAFFGASKDFNGKIIIDDTKMESLPPKKFLYLPNPAEIPGEIKTLDLLAFFKRSLKLSKIESGIHAPGFSILYKLTTIFKVSLDYVVSGEGEMFLKSKSRSAISNGSILKRIDTVEDLNWFLEHSSVFRNTVLAFAAKFRFDNESMINNDMQISSEPE